MNDELGLGKAMRIKVVVDNMDQWSHNIANTTLSKEFEHVPPAVAAMACVYYIRRLCGDIKNVVTHSAMAKIILAGEEETVYKS